MSVQMRTLVTLPLELQLDIIAYLTYPDALALSLTSRHFRGLATPSLTVVSRISWLLDRARVELPIPKAEKLKFNTDAEFLQNTEVQSILRARKSHSGCAIDWGKLRAGKRSYGCLVFLESPEGGSKASGLNVEGEGLSVWLCTGRKIWLSKEYLERLERDCFARIPSRLMRLRCAGREYAKRAAQAGLQVLRLHKTLGLLIFQIVLGLLVVVLVQGGFAGSEQWWHSRSVSTSTRSIGL